MPPPPPPKKRRLPTNRQAAPHVCDVDGKEQKGVPAQPRPHQTPNAPHRCRNLGTFFLCCCMCVGPSCVSCERALPGRPRDVPPLPPARGAFLHTSHSNCPCPLFPTQSTCGTHKRERQARSLQHPSWPRTASKKRGKAAHQHTMFSITFMARNRFTILKSVAGQGRGGRPCGNPPCLFVVHSASFSDLAVGQHLGKTMP